MPVTKEQLIAYNANRTTPHEILFYDAEKTLVFGKCETTDTTKSFFFSVPPEMDGVPLVHSRTFRGEILVYDTVTGELGGKLSDPEWQADGLGSSDIPAGNYEFVLMPNTLQYCVSSTNQQHKIAVEANWEVDKNSALMFAEFDSYLCVYGKALVDGEEVEDTMLEPNTYSSIEALDTTAYCSQINIIDLKSGQRLGLAEAKSLKVAEINTKAESLITSGFNSSALGSPHTYQSDRDDQLNLLGTYQAGVDSLFKCLPSNSEEWEWKLHTPEQLKQVIQDGAAYKSELLQRANLLKGQVKAATVKRELNSIAW